MSTRDRLLARLRRRRELTEQLAAARSIALNLAKVERERERVRLDVGRLDYAHAEIFLNVPSRAALRRLRSCSKEPWTVAWIESRLRPGQTLWDVGANVGAYALVAAKASAAKVVAVEPGYATFAVLCDNIGLNELEQSIIPLQLALTRTTGLMSLTYSDVAAGRALHRIEESDVDSSARSQPVLGYALDDLLERFRLPPPNHVKLDVDGAEAAVIAGARATLARPNLESVLVEVHAAEAAQVDAELLGAGLTQIEEYRPTPKPDRPPPAHVYRLYARER